MATRVPLKGSTGVIWDLGILGVGALGFGDDETNHERASGSNAG